MFPIPIDYVFSRLLNPGNRRGRSLDRPQNPMPSCHAVQLPECLQIERPTRSHRTAKLKLLWMEWSNKQTTAAGQMKQMRFVEMGFVLSGWFEESITTITGTLIHYFLNCITTTLKSVRCGKASRPEQNLSKSACEKRLGRKCSWNSCQSHIKLLLVIGGGWTWRHTLDGLCTFVGIPVLVWARKRRGSSTKSGIWVPGRKLPGRTFAANLDHQLWIALNGIINNW